MVSSLVTRSSWSPAKYNVGQLTCLAYSAGLWANALKLSCTPPKKVSSSAIGKLGNPITANLFLTLWYRVPKGYSRITPATAKSASLNAFKTAAAPILVPNKKMD